MVWSLHLSGCVLSWIFLGTLKRLIQPFLHEKSKHLFHKKYNLKNPFVQLLVVSVLKNLKKDVFLESIFQQYAIKFSSQQYFDFSKLFKTIHGQCTKTTLTSWFKWFFKEGVVYCTDGYDMITKGSFCYLVPPASLSPLLIRRQEVTDWKSCSTHLTQEKKHHQECREKKICISPWSHPCLFL